MSRSVTTINPATGEPLQSYDAAGLDDVLAILDAVHTAQPGWGPWPSGNAPTACGRSAPSSASSATSWPHS
jgi:acyl-CoA reductase-like NAD-dependent aldehyde dehydrogenase